MHNGLTRALFLHSFLKRFGVVENSEYLCRIIMDWEAFEKHKPFAGEKKPSMLRRRVGHDYESRRIYLITMTVEGRRPLLGRLVGDAEAEEGSPEAPRIELSPLGKEVKNCWTSIPNYYPEVKVLAITMMPDHLHGILFVERQMEQHLGMVIKGFKAGCNKAYRRWLASQEEQEGKAMPQQCCSKEDNNSSKEKDSNSSKENDEKDGNSSKEGNKSSKEKGSNGSNSNDRTHGFLFSRNYNDHILEGPDELERWFNYLDDNPRRLAVKRQHPEFFTIVRQRNIGEWSCQMVGNQALLTYPEKAAVVVHSAWSDEEYEMKKRKWLALGEKGGVLISASIATREKLVMREAMNRGYRLIVLRENGFPPLYKPAGESFDACSNGTLLQISPWEYHMNRRTISREQCLQLNRLAELIVG